MLKSTHKPAAGPPLLPPGWTEHSAPTGHTYYYNTVTKRSTYTRPSPLPLAVSLPPAIPTYLVQGLHNVHGSFDGGFGSYGQPQDGPPRGPGFGSQPPHQYALGGRREHQPQRQRRAPEDRPKHKQIIPGCSPWVLVKTKLGQRFVYNPELKESFWKFPPEVMRCVIELDRAERERRVRIERGETINEDEIMNEVSGKVEGTVISEKQKIAEYDSDEYEEVEVTDGEDDEGGVTSNRFKGEIEEPLGPLEFNEDDIAYQLDAMGHDENGEHEEEQGDWEGYEEPPLEESDAIALFKDLLDDFNINPYTPWSTVIEEGKIIEDERYTCLPNSKSRKEAWSSWSRDAIQKLKEQRERQEKQDPRIPYLTFLQKNATPKLYWPEFRRKYNKEPEMRDRKLPDKDREKLYREYINRLKLPEHTLKDDLKNLLKSQSLHLLNRSTSLSALPPAILTDLRYISLRLSIRDPLIEAFISLLPAAPEETSISPDEEAERLKQTQDRARRENALAERERRVQEQKRRQAAALRTSKGMLMEEEAEVERAMRVGKEGFLKHLASEDGDAVEAAHEGR